jgi:hypothetical protein
MRRIGRHYPARILTMGKTARVVFFLMIGAGIYAIWSANRAGDGSSEEQSPIRMDLPWRLVEPPADFGRASSGHVDTSARLSEWTAIATFESQADCHRALVRDKLGCPRASQGSTTTPPPRQGKGTGRIHRIVRQPPIASRAQQARLDGVC